MKKQITITYSNGESEIHTAFPPDFAKWEKATGKSISEFSGMWDILFVAHSAMKREAAGKPVKPLEVWMESVTDINVGDDDPKATNAEA